MNNEENAKELARLRARVAELEARQRGGKVPSSFSRGYFGFFGALAAVLTMALLAVILLAGPTRQPTQPETQAVSTRTADRPIRDPSIDFRSLPHVRLPTVDVSPWSYSEEADALHDVKTKFACTTSTNEVQLSFPYHNVTANLSIRKGPRHGLDAYVQLNGDGQILCDIDSCTVHVRIEGSDSPVCRSYKAAVDAGAVSIGARNVTIRIYA